MIMSPCAYGHADVLVYPVAFKVILFPEAEQWGLKQSRYLDWRRSKSWLAASEAEAWMVHKATDPLRCPQCAVDRQ